MKRSQVITAPSRPSLRILSWQGWQLELPARWNPVKIEGDYDSGSVLIADLHRPRLGMRWRKGSKRFDPKTWAPKALRDEVGQLATAEATPHPLDGSDWQSSSVYIEPEPPGRDVWVGYSTVSRRCLEIVHHAHRRESVLTGTILPSLRDAPREQSKRWAVFDLSCESPAGLKLVSHRLNAGDLSLSFEDNRRLVAVRQIALAEMALKRRELKQWLADQEARKRKYYRLAGELTETELAGELGRRLRGVWRESTRRKRFFLIRSLPPKLITAALHDAQRDRLIIVQASDELLLRQAALGVGWAG